MWSVTPTFYLIDINERISFWLLISFRILAVFNHVVLLTVNLLQGGLFIRWRHQYLTSSSWYSTCARSTSSTEGTSGSSTLFLHSSSEPWSCVGCTSNSRKRTKNGRRRFDMTVLLLIELFICVPWLLTFVYKIGKFLNLLGFLVAWGEGKFYREGLSVN